MTKERAPPNKLEILNDAFHGKGINQDSLVLDLSSVSPKEPKTFLVIEIAGVTGAVPYQLVNFELSFLITHAVVVTAQNMWTLYDDIPWLLGLTLDPRKFALS